MLFLPLLDRQWLLSKTSYYPDKRLFRSLALLSGTILLVIYPDYLWPVINNILLSALPEEWFFRAYLMLQIEKMLINSDTFLSKDKKALSKKIKFSPYLASPHTSSNIITSLLFSLLHTPSQGWIGLSIFFPSLLFGWLYQKHHDLFLIIVIHALSNEIFFVFLQKYL